MFWSILGVFAGAFTAYGLFKATTDYMPTTSDYVMGVIFGLFLGACVWAVVYVGANAIVYAAMSPKYDYHRSDLVALEDGSAVHGQFAGNLFVSTGYINQELTYTYYTQTGENTFYRDQADASATDIHYYDGTPYVVKHVEKVRNKWFASITFQGWHGWDLYVPKGSITSGIILDNKG